MTEPMDDDIEAILEVIVEGTTGPRSRVDIMVHEIKGQQCACCGLPAKVSFYHLKRRERTLLCGSCRPPTRLSATPTSTAE